jgi:hypothetical protein
VAGGSAVATQMTMTLSDQGSGSTLFRFTNTGPTASTITASYLQIGGLLSSLAFQSASAGVDMSVTADPTPPNLPGEASLTPPFVKTTGAFHADRNSSMTERHRSGRAPRTAGHAPQRDQSRATG